MKKNIAIKLVLGFVILAAPGTVQSAQQEPPRKKIWVKLDKALLPPFHLAARIGNVFEMRRLLDQGVRIDVRDNHDNTALHQARSEKVVKFLLEQGAHVDARNDVGATPLHYAASRAFGMRTAPVLIEHGAYVTAQDQDGATPMHVAAAFFNSPVVELLHKNGGDVMARNKRGFTPLHGAVGMGRVMRDMIPAYATLGVIETGGAAFLGVLAAGISSLALVGAAAGTAVALGAIYGTQALLRRQTVDMLLDKGADVNAKDNLGNTPLHIMASGSEISLKVRKGGPFLARHLMQRAADVTIQNSKDKTPYDIAKAFSRIRLMEALAPGATIREGVAGVKYGARKAKGAYQEAKRRYGARGETLGLEE